MNDHTDTTSPSPIGNSAFPGRDTFTVEGFPVLANASSVAGSLELNLGDGKGMLKLAEEKGSDILQAPFPGEPEDITPGTRSKLWGMRLLHDESFMTMARTRVRKLTSISNSITCFGTLFSITLGMSSCIGGIFAFKYDRFFSSGIGLLIFITSLAAPTILGLFISFLLSDIPSARSICINRLLDDVAQCWPRKFVQVLQMATMRHVRLSTELHALKIVLVNTTGEKRQDIERSWTKLSVSDEIGMIALATNLSEQLDSMPEGAQLGLGGDNSELVHRACATAFPGKLDSAIDQLENPSFVKV